MRKSLENPTVDSVYSFKQGILGKHNAHRQINISAPQQKCLLLLKVNHDTFNYCSS